MFLLFKKICWIIRFEIDDLAEKLIDVRKKKFTATFFIFC